jgi:2-desacetyl-2-hydroxyethyl bacteriochlorophyllide A dehydrogenase
MQAARFYADGTVTVETVPDPSPQEQEVLVKVLACGICGTDLRLQEGQFLAEQYPLTPGHEIAGRAVRVGRQVKHVHEGDLVAVNPNAACGVCYWCLRGRPHLCPQLVSIGVNLPGGFAEYVVVPGRQLLVMPRDFSPEAAAMLEPTSCCLHGIDQAAIRPGDPTIILGGGSIGLILLQLAKHAGAAPVVVVEPVEAKRQLAQALGADATLDPTGLDEGTLRARLTELTDGGGEVVLEASGHPSAAAVALGLVRRGGTVVFFGVQPPDLTLPLKPFDIYHHEITIRGAFTNPLTDGRARTLLITHRVEVWPLITHRFALADLPAALDVVRRGETIKAMVLP